METFLLVFHIILSFVIVVVILMQSGQGGGMGAGFGGAAAVGQELFGGRGAATFLGKLTVVLGASFMITSMALAWYSSKPQSLLDLGQGAGTTTQAQVHQVLEEGSGAWPGAGELDLDLDLDALEPSQGEIQEITPEMLEEFQREMERQMQESGDVDAPSIELTDEPQEVEVPESTEEAPAPVEEAPAPVEEAPAPVEEAPAEAEEVEAAPAEAEEVEATEETEDGE